jgi:fatty-acyl-CoA synthase/long-chain acyl-CoA synthetase
MNFVAAIEWSSRRYGQRVAISGPRGERTFAEVDARANALAHGLVELGIGKGDRVGICIGNEPEFVEAEWAVAKAGAVRVPILVTSSVQDVVHYIEFADLTAIVASSEGLGIVRSALASMGARAQGLVLVAIGEAAEGEQDYEQLIETSPQSPLQVPLTPDDMYAIRFTGGTTGLPKGVAMSHRSVIGMINNMLLSLDVRTDDVLCHIHPLSHAAGMLLSTWWMRGARQLILPAFDFRAEALLEVIQRERVTSLFTIPTALNVLLDCPTLADYDTSSLRRIYYGGAPISPRRITEALEAFGPILTQVYGHSESPMVLSVLEPEDHVFSGDPPARLGSAGRPICNVEVRVVNEDGVDCAVGEIGEIISRGDNRFVGYWKDEDLTARKTLPGGWVKSGDVARWDEDGYLYLVDRHDDLIITGGFNVWPAEVEKVVCAHPAVAEGVVVGLPDDHWGEAVTAVVVPRPGHVVDAAELIQFAKQQLPSYKAPKTVFVQDEPLPKSPVGKLLRRAVKERYRHPDHERV